MVKKEVFTCDQCGKHSNEVIEGSDPPYLDGWRYLEEFEFKASLNYRHEVIRKHFCSSACMLAFIAHFIKEQEEKLHFGSPIESTAKRNGLLLKAIAA